jgi:hypothetical protein
MVQSKRQVKDKNRKRKARNYNGLATDRIRVYSNYAYRSYKRIDFDNGASEVKLSLVGRKGKEDHTILLAKTATTEYFRHGAKLAIRILNCKGVREKLVCFLYHNPKVKFNSVGYSRGLNLVNCFNENPYDFDKWLNVSGIESKEQLEKLVSLNGVKEYNITE